MLHFVVPLKSRQVCHDWDHIQGLLELTLFTLLRQSDPRFRVSLICHELPELPGFIRDAIDLIEVDYAAPALGMSREIRRRDKVLKQTVGLQRAINVGSTYVMYVDADDLVSRDMTRLVHDLEPAHVLLLKRGYVLDQNSGLMWEVDRFNSLCGSSAVFKVNAPRMSPFVDQVLNLDDKQLCLDSANDIEPQYFIAKHARYERLAVAEGLTVNNIEQPKVIYRWGHGDNNNNPEIFRLSLSKKIRHFLPQSFSSNKRWTPRKRDASLNREFGIT